MSETTYGALLVEAERHLVEAIFATREPFRSAHQARHTADEYAQILVALKAGVRTLAGVATPGHPAIEPPATSAAGVLFHALADAISRFEGSAQARSWRGEWNACARAISAATALLASHLGPNRAHRTPDASLLDAPEAQRAGLYRLAIFALTAADGGRHLALRVRDASIRFQRPGKLGTTAQWLMTIQAAIGTAAAAVIHNRHASASGSGLFTLQPAPLLVPTQAGDPIATARKSFDRLRLIAHRQARSEIAAGIDAIRAHATAGMLVASHGHAIAAAVGEKYRDTDSSEKLESVARALLALRQPWAQLLNTTERCATTRFSPPLLGREVACFSDNLAFVTRHSEGWRRPLEILLNQRVEERLLNLLHHLGCQLPDVATAVGAVVERLYERGDLLIPTRERDDFDMPYRWAPISAERLSELRNAGQVAYATAAKAAATVDAVLNAGITPQRRAQTSSSLEAIRTTPARQSTQV